MSLKDFVTKQKFRALITDYGDYFEFDVLSFGGMLAVQKGFAKSLNFYEAREYAKNLNLGGYNDWTIPSKDALIALFQLQKIYGLKPSEDSFWSSSLFGNMSKKPTLSTVSFSINPDDSGLVLSTSLDFYPFGKVFFANPSDWYECLNLRCVRICGTEKQEMSRNWLKYLSLFKEDIGWTYSVEELSENFIDRGDYIEFKKPIGTIRMIQKVGKKMSGPKAEFLEELDIYLKNLRSGGYSDWRIPTAEECKIIDQIKVFSGINYDDFTLREINMNPNINDRLFLSIYLFAVR